MGRWVAARRGEGTGGAGQGGLSLYKLELNKRASRSGQEVILAIRPAVALSRVRSFVAFVRVLPALPNQ